jgi:sigma-E factor negative regulatory protein RseC
MSEQIEHEGIVVAVEPEKVVVRIKSATACGTCSAVNICGSDSMSDKLIDVRMKQSSFHIGDEVWVAIRKQSAFKAAFIAYVVPSILAVFTLFICNLLKVNEVVSAFLSLLFIALYLIFLWMIRNKLKQTFTFSLHRKQSTDATV